MWWLLVSIDLYTSMAIGIYNALGGIDLDLLYVIINFNCLWVYLLLLYIVGFFFRDDLGLAVWLRILSIVIDYLFGVLLLFDMSTYSPTHVVL